MAEVKEAITENQAGKERWEKETLQKVLDKTPERKEKFEGVSLEAVERLYTQADAENLEDIGFPGEFPYKRGIHPTGYRGRLWTMRQFAGFSSPEETNKRFKYLMMPGQTGLSTAYDLPALMVCETVTSSRLIPSKRTSKSAKEETATPHLPTSPSESGESASKPIKAGRS